IAWFSDSCRGEGGGTKGGATKTTNTTEQQRLVLIGPKSQDKHTGGEREMPCRAKC
ncbi:hypothetical protein GIB67_022751, partial [Kingdonia uniflora]